MPYRRIRLRPLLRNTQFTQGLFQRAAENLRPAAAMPEKGNIFPGLVLPFSKIDEVNSHFSFFLKMSTIFQDLTRSIASYCNRLYYIFQVTFLL